MKASHNNLIMIPPQIFDKYAAELTVLEINGNKNRMELKKEIASFAATLLG